MLEHFGIKARLLLLVGALVGLNILISGLGMRSLGQVSAKYEEIPSNDLRKLEILMSVRMEIQNYVRNVIKLSVPGNSAEEASSLYKKIEKARENFEARNADYGKTQIGQEESALRDRLVAHWKDLNEIGLATAALHMSRDPDRRAEGLRRQKTDFDKAYHTVFADIGDVSAEQKKDTDSGVQDARATAAFARNLSIGITVLGSLIGFLAGWLYSSGISREFNRIVRRLHEGATRLTDFSRQVAETGSQLSSGSTQQASAIQQTAASVNEINAMVGKNAENAQRSETVSHDSETTASRGLGAVREMLRSIEEINASNLEISGQMERNNQEMAKIVQVISEIGSKTRVINDIVFQTKLLSFNASVEAARAGESGKGFAVVAEEVGNLAQMSGTAAQEISRLLDESIREVERTAKETREKIEALIDVGKQRVNKGGETARRCSEVLEEIARSVTETKQRVGQISVASREQSQGVSEISKAIGELETVTEQNASASRQVAHTAEQLNHEAETIRQAISSLMRVVQGSDEGGDVHSSRAA